MSTDLTYGKWGTHVEINDEESDSLMDFVHDGARMTLAQPGLEQLPGPAERIEKGSRGEWGDLVLYLWPYVRTGVSAPLEGGAS